MSVCDHKCENLQWIACCFNRCIFFFSQSDIWSNGELFDQIVWLLDASRLQESLCLSCNELPLVLVIIKAFLQDVEGEQSQVDGLCICATFE